MEMLDGTIVVTAAPKISQSLHVPVSSVSLVITAYLVALGALIPVGGWLTTRYGPRAVFLSAIAIFTLASLGCALSQTLGELVALRAIQGAGGALMVPVGRYVVLRDAKKSEVVRLVAYLVWPALVAPVIAPLLGGVITTYAGWQWIFVINIPLGIVAFLFARVLMPRTHDEQRQSLDVLGAILTCGALGGLTYAAHLIADTSPGTLELVIAFAGSIALLAAATVHLMRVQTPLVNLRTLRYGTFRQSTIGMFAFLIPVGATPFLLPLLFQTVFGWSAVKSGAVVLFVFLGNISIKPATTPLLNRFGFRRTLIAATVLLAVTMAGCAVFMHDTPLAVIAAVSLLSGVARSTGMTVYTTLAYADVEPGETRDANTLSLTAQQVGSGMGVAAGAIALRFGGALTSTERDAYATAFVVMALVALTATAGALRLERGAGDALLT
jgi:EmrB/QacA subfamily drug resistance transporter